MHPFIRAAVVCAGFTALGSRAPAPTDGGRVATAGAMRALTTSNVPPAGTSADAWSILSAFCEPGSLPDGDVCVHIPDDDADGAELFAAPGAHRDKRGRYHTYDQIPRRPERPAEYAAYRYPVPISAATLAMSGYDLDRPENEQRQGRKFSQVGHGGVDLAAPRATEVRLVALEHQDGDAEVVFAGKLFGTTVVTRHAVREGGKLRDYVVLYGHLDATASGVIPGAGELKDGALLGFVGDSGSPGIVHLHLEIRRVRDGIDVRKLPAERLVDNETTIVCDPRNVLPLR
jgi:murein DD-endopeptidase MepM/ murein hydrolase activator NlpD